MRWLPFSLALVFVACPQATPLVGAGPRVMVQPSAVTFAELARGATASADLTLSNVGNGTLSVQHVALSGASAEGFDVAPLETAQLQAGESLRISLRFAPARAGEHSATLRIVTDAIDLAQLDVPVQGHAVEPADCAALGTEGRPCDDREPCTASDVCRDGLCRGEPVMCAEPPGPLCDTPSSLVSFQSPGTCRAGRCEYTSVGSSCVEGCVQGSCLPDPCAGVTCNTPPPCGDPGQCVGGTCQYPMRVGCGGARGLAAGFQESCAIGADAGVWCWGVNPSTLGDGVSTMSSLPVRVLTSSAAVQLTDGCALEVGGAVECWGFNGSGGVGDGTFIDRPTPVRIAFDAGVLSLSRNTAGGGLRCALLHGGRVQCWGSNNQGQLGDGTLNDRNVPTDVAGLPSDVTGVFLGFLHSCATTASGGLWCWGHGASGELGTGTPWDAGALVPQRVPSTSGSNASLGVNFTCALSGPRGAVLCWGNNDAAQLGTGAPDAGPALGPVSAVAVGSGFRHLAAGLYFVCGLRDDGSVWCWGSNEHGAVGRGDVSRLQATPFRVPLDGGVVELSAGATHVCARRVDGRVTCWGSNQWGQLGNGVPLQMFWHSGPVDALLR